MYVFPRLLLDYIWIDIYLWTLGGSVCLSVSPVHQSEREIRKEGQTDRWNLLSTSLFLFTQDLSAVSYYKTQHAGFLIKMFFSLGVPAEVACTEGELMTASAMSVTIAKRVIDFFYVLQCTTRLENLRKMAKMINQRSFRYVKYSIAKCIFGLF